MTVSVVIPWRDSGCPHRHRAFLFVAARYSALYGPESVEVGVCASGSWSKGAAVADGVSRVSGDVLVIADADCFIDPAALEAAVEQTADFGWVVPHLTVHRLTEEGSARVYAGDTPRGEWAWRSHRGPPGGGITVLTLSAYEAVGGIDPRFEGWGGEDVSFGWALHTLVNPPMRYQHPLWHLWHAPAAPRGEADQPRGSDEAEALVARYRAARKQPDMMRRLIDERKVAC